MTESDDAATRKSILGHFNLDSGTASGVVVSVGYLLLSILLEQQLLPES